MTPPTEKLPTYPRIPHLADPDGHHREDRVLTRDAREAFFRHEAIVEEKLDGANIVLARDDHGVLRMAGRSGAEGRDRGRQLGRLRAWMAERAASLETITAGMRVYGEWLYRTHSIHYDRLPDYLVIIDWWEDGCFLDRLARERRAEETGLVTAPLVFEGRLANLKQLEALPPESAFGNVASEGFVLRLEDEGCVQERAKWVRPGFVQISDEAWEHYQLNEVVGV